MLDLDALLPRLHVVALPMATRFRGIQRRETVLLEGDQRWTEWSPFPEYDDVEAASWLEAALEYGFDRRLEIAAHGAVPVNATVPAIDAAAVPGVLERFGPCRAVKVKVAEAGQTLEDDLARVAAVRRAVGASVALRVDANGGWSVEEAVAALRRLADLGLEYAEQPVREVEDLARVRERLAGRVAIAADESIRKASDPLRVVRLGAADRIIVKAQPLGGIERAAAVVLACGLPATVSSALESSVGIAMGAQLALRIGGMTSSGPAPAGLGTAALFVEDVVDPARRPIAGMVDVSPAIPDPERLARLAAPDERRAWWIERLRRCLPLACARMGCAEIEPRG